MKRKLLYVMRKLVESGKRNVQRYSQFHLVTKFELRG